MGLDDIKPTLDDGLYKVELQAEGQWVLICSLSKESIKMVADYAEMLSMKDNSGEER